MYVCMYVVEGRKKERKVVDGLVGITMGGERERLWGVHRCATCLVCFVGVWFDMDKRKRKKKRKRSLLILDSDYRVLTDGRKDTKAEAQIELRRRHALR